MLDNEPIVGAFTFDEWSQIMAAVDAFATGSRLAPEKREVLRSIRDRILALLTNRPAGS